MNYLRNARSPESEFSEWSDKLQEQVFNRSPYGHQIKHSKHFGGGGTKVRAYDPYVGTGVRELYQQLGNVFGPTIQRGGLTPYGGQMYPGPSPLQQQGFGMMGSLTPMAGQAQDITQESLGLYSPAQGQRAQQLGMGGLEQVMQPFDPSRITQAFKPVRELGMQTYMEDIVPALAEKYGPALGARRSGAFGRALAKGGQDLALGLSAQAAPWYMQGYENQMNRMAQGIPMSQQMAMGPMSMLNQALGGVGQYPFQVGQGLMGAGGVQRGIAGEQLADPYEKWRISQPWAPEYLNMLSLPLGQPPKEIVGMQKPAGLGYSMLSGLAPGIGFGMGQAGLGQLAGGAGSALSFLGSLI